MAVSPRRAFEPPDTIAALPRRPFEFSPQAASARPTRSWRRTPDGLFRRLLSDQESEAVLLAARRIIDAFLAAACG